MRHIGRYFEQDDCTVIHPVAMIGYHVDILLYPPNEKFPFWKLVTMGASDYKMPKIQSTIERRNEYILFVSSAENLDDKQTAEWYCQKLWTVACYAYVYKTHITYAHSFERENDDPNDQMMAAFIDFPQVIPNAGILRWKAGPFKKVACLQVYLMNREDLDLLMQIGPKNFSEYLYPEDENAPMHFLSERVRSHSG